MVEGFCQALQDGTAPSGCFDSLHFLTYGGAALKPHCGEILRQFGISAKCTCKQSRILVLHCHVSHFCQSLTDGQTEVGGAVCFGKVGGDLNALTMLPGVSFTLLSDAEDGDDFNTVNSGQLVFHGMYCATSGPLFYVCGLLSNPTLPS
jgi:hypothetical protein